MLETVIAITVAVILWTLRKAFNSQASLWSDKVDIMVGESRVDQQEDIKELHDRVVETKAKNGDRWFSVKDIEDLMK